MLVDVARRFYLEDQSKIEIAKELGLSRFKVARMLQTARSAGIVEIRLNDVAPVDRELSRQLSAHLSLEEVVVVASGHEQGQVFRDVGRATADLLTRTLREGDVLGMSWGRTTSAMTDFLISVPPVSVVQLAGAVGSDLTESPVEVVRRVSASAGQRARAIFAPLMVQDAATADALRRQPDVAQALELFDHVTVAVLSVGSWDPPDSRLRESMSPEDRGTLDALGIRAEIAGIFLDDAGASIDAGFAERCISISAEQLRTVPRVIAAAGGAQKAGAVRASVASGLITCLVTDESLASAALELAPVLETAQSRGRRA